MTGFTPFTAFSYPVTRGTTPRKEVDRWIDGGLVLSETGVDCSGVADSSVALQAAIDAAPNSTNLILPPGAIIKLSSTINIVNRLGVQFVSPSRAVNTDASAPRFVWSGSGGTMFNISASDHPAFKGIVFNGTGGGFVDTYLKFDGARVNQTPTLAKVESCTFNASVANANHIAISIAPTANSNHENYQILDCDINGAGSTTTKRAVDGVINNTSTGLSSATAAFVAGDVGKRLRVTYAGGALDTTVASVTNGTTAVMSAPATSTQTGATVHIGTSVGIGLQQKGSNTFHTHLYGLRVSGFAIGLDLQNGSFDMQHYGGGFNDIGVNLVNVKGEIAFYDAEGDMQAVAIAEGFPILISNMRMTTANARADAWISTGTGLARLLITGALCEDGTYPTNAVIFPNNATARIVSIGNYYAPMTRAQINLANCASAVSLNDAFDAGLVSTNFFGLPTADPHVVGQLWENSGVLTISAG